MFYWQPAPGFLGRYRLVFGSDRERLAVRAVAWRRARERQVSG